MSDIPKLLRAIAGGTQAQENKHDVIFNAAADEIERLRADLAEIARLRLATDEGSLRVRADRMWEIASRRALEGK